ncbi:MAG: phosphoribosylglycinamide formyltransferase [SAR86 cluster bacterium]|nr:phosphoribosylglycinamide formyltransferase [SAR86 cluster bacterium]
MNTFKVAVLISGNGSNLQALIDSFKKEDSDIDINCVISNKKDAFGLERAARASIDNHFVDHTKFKNRETFDQELIQILDGYDPDLIVLAGFMRILSEVFIEKYMGKLINIHPSLLPKYPGLDTHQKVIENNDRLHGVTVHYVDKSLDSGPVCGQSMLEVETTDVEELQNQIHKLEHKLYPHIVSLIAEGKMTFDKGKVIKNT